MQPILEIDRRAHYELERKLSDRLRFSTRAERTKLYNEVYNEIYTKVPYLLPLQIKISKDKLSSDLRLVSLFINKNSKYLEVGPGNCLFAFAMCKNVASVTAVDVSTAVTNTATMPKNFNLVISDGTSIPVTPKSINTVYSNQLMEHLHPDDAVGQLKNIYQALVSGGVYICRTPNRLSGPHDVSRYYDDIATGFHLKEYTVTELIKLMRQIGFKKFKILFSVKGFVIAIPNWVIAGLEELLQLLPRVLSRPIARFRPIRMILGINLVAIK